MYNSLNDMYSTFTDVFWFIIDTHVPIKTKNARGNQGPIIVKQVQLQWTPDI